MHFLVGSTSWLVMGTWIFLGLGSAYCEDIRESSKNKNSVRVSENITNSDKDGCAPLHLAVITGCKDTVEQLLSDKADANAKDNNGRTPLHYMAGNDFEDKYEPAGPGGRGVGVDYKGITELLLAHNADVNAKDNNGRAPLHSAAEYGNMEVAELLLDHNADMNALDKWGNTPLHIALYADNPNVAELLLARHARINVKDIRGITPLHIAARQDFLNTLNLLLANISDVNATDVDGNTPLHVAAKERNKEVSERLITNKAHVNATNRNGDSPLHFVLRNSEKDTSELSPIAVTDTNAMAHKKINPRFSPKLHGGSRDVFCRSTYKEMVVFLLANNADVNPRNNDGATPYALAVKNGHQDAAKLLLQHGGHE